MYLKRLSPRKPRLLSRLKKAFIVGALCISAFTYAQDGKNIISDSEAIFSKSLFTKAKGGDATLKINLIGEESSKLQINFSEGNANNNYRVLGDLNGATSVKDGSTVVIEKSNGKVSGRIVSFEEKKAYKIFTNEQGQIVSEEVDINHVACVNYRDQEEDHNHKGHDAHKRDTSNDTFSRVQPEYESLPGASHVIYLDFDGELVRNTSWNNGRDINAQPSGMSDQSILNVWRNIAEDFAAFKVNVTTKRSAYDAVPKNRRIMCIWTPTKTAAPSAGGVAWLNGFSANNDEPCWAFIMRGDQPAGEVGSHEIGHTLGLRHDGKSGGTTYYGGHNGWAPIMGVSYYYSRVGHWSKGEYSGANNQEDDVAVMANSRNGFGYKTDDHGNTTANATALVSDASGNVSANSNKGLIEKRTDKDVFSFSTSGGNVDFKIDPNQYYASLDIKARILNSNGQEVASSDLAGLNAAINTNLDRGTYYIEIDGVGSGANPSVGYSDYSSLGNFTISGKYPKEGDADTQAPTAPSGLAAANETQSTIDLTWEASTDNVGVTGYDVYRGNTMIATVAGTRYQATGLTAGTEYSFRVKAKDAAGNESAFSNTATASTLPEEDTQAPTAPSGLAAANETQSTIDLTWEASTDNVAVTGYDVYQGDTMIATVPGTRYQAAGLTPGTEYSFRVKAKDAAGNESAFSNTATASTLPEDNTDTEAPTAPTELMADNETQTTIDLSWMASTDNVGVTGYEVYQGDVMIATVEGTRYQVMGLTPGTEYSFSVLAMDAAGNKSRFSNTATASTLPEDNTDTEAPTVPTELAASNIKQTTLTLNWMASTDNVAVTGYNVYQGTTMIGTSVTTSFNVSGLTAATTYQFTVVAMDAAGNMSEASNVATATTKDEDTTNICEGVAPWQWGVPYQTGDRVVYRGNLFEKLERGWKFIGKCGASSCEGVADWKSGTNYSSGDQVVYRGNLWQRTDRGWIFVSSCGAKSSKIAPPQERFAVYPNPSSGTINTTYTLSDQRTTYSISDMLGRIVAKGEYTSTAYDVSQLKAGTYIFIITTNKASYKTAFVKE